MSPTHETSNYIHKEETDLQFLPNLEILIFLMILSILIFMYEFYFLIRLLFLLSSSFNLLRFDVQRLFFTDLLVYVLKCEVHSINIVCDVIHHPPPTLLPIEYNGILSSHPLEISLLLTRLEERQLIHFAHDKTYY